MELWQYCVY